MELEILIKVSSIIAAMIGVGKFLHEMKVGSKPRLWGEYESTKKFFSDLANEPELHPFIKAKGYQAIAGIGNVNNEEIAYLLSLKEPDKCLINYKLSRKYLIFNSGSNDPHISFKKRYFNPKFRKLTKYVSLILYVFFFAVALCPLFMSSQYTKLLFVTMPPFLYLAFICLDKYDSLKRAEFLVSNQQRHNNKIISNGVGEIHSRIERTS